LLRNGFGDGQIDDVEDIFTTWCRLPNDNNWRVDGIKPSKDPLRSSIVRRHLRQLHNLRASSGVIFGRHESGGHLEREIRPERLGVGFALLHELRGNQVNNSQSSMCDQIIDQSLLSKVCGHC